MSKEDKVGLLGSPYEAEMAPSVPKSRIRRSLLTIGSLFLILLWNPFTYLPIHRSDHSDCPKALTIKERANKVLAENPLIDGHNDLLITIRGRFQNHINNESFTKGFEEGGLVGHVDIPRIEEGKYGGAFWSAFMPCPKNGSSFADEHYAETVRATLEQLDTFNRLSTLYPKYFTPTPSAASALTAFSQHRLISPLAIEGLHQIGNSLSTLRLYHALGVRYATLTWNCHNAYADAALTSDLAKRETVVATPYWHGISEKGDVLIKEMNRLGMIVDLSHVSKETMLDVLGGTPAKTNGSIAPPIFSHSSAYAICPHPRNVQDDVLQLVKARKSLVMINFSPDFISCTPGNSSTGLPDFDPENSTLEQVVRHIMYIGDLIGYDYVGIGTDYDGIDTTPKGLEDVSKFPALVAKLLEAGVSDEDAGKVVGRNLLRVWAEVDGVAERLQKTMLPAEDDVGGW